MRSRTSGEDWSLTVGFDASVEDFAWAADGQSLVFPAQDAGKEALWAVDVAGGAVRRIVSGGVNTAAAASADNRFVVYVHSSLTEPAEVWRADATHARIREYLARTVGRK